MVGWLAKRQRQDVDGVRVAARKEQDAHVREAAQRSTTLPDGVSTARSEYFSTENTDSKY
jgi:hypothetical protein